MPTDSLKFFFIVSTHCADFAYALLVGCAPPCLGRYYTPDVCFTPGDKILEDWRDKDEYYQKNITWEVDAVVDEVGKPGQVPHMVLVKWKVSIIPQGASKVVAPHISLLIALGSFGHPCA